MAYTPFLRRYMRKELETRLWSQMRFTMSSWSVSSVSSGSNDGMPVWHIQSEVNAMRTKDMEMYIEGWLGKKKKILDTSLHGFDDFQCKLKLKCGIHICGMICHDPSKCPPCSKKGKQPCLCGNSVQERNCDDSVWQCEKTCNKVYPCGLHTCQLKCHIGYCGDCPLGLPRLVFVFFLPSFSFPFFIFFRFPRECPCGKQVGLTMSFA